MGGTELSNTEIVFGKGENLGLGEHGTGRDGIKLGGKGGEIIRKHLKRVRVTEIRVCNLCGGFGKPDEERSRIRHGRKSPL